MKYKAQLTKIRKQIDEAFANAPLNVDPPPFGVFTEGVNEPSPEWLAQASAYCDAYSQRGIQVGDGGLGVTFRVVNRENFPQGSVTPDGVVVDWHSDLDLNSKSEAKKL